MTDIEKNIAINNMKRVWSVYCDPLIKQYLSDIEKFEKDRVYCRHGWDHLINTARIAYILNLENNYGIGKEIIYTAALLHDIGRVREYKDGIPHDKAGAEIAKEVLARCMFDKDEIELITNAIFSHRSISKDISQGKESMSGDLAKLIYDADKLSRECYLCSAYDSCKWKDERKNKFIII